MPEIRTLAELIPELGPVVRSRDPIGALSQAGIELAPSLRSTLGDAILSDPLGPAGRRRAAELGPTPRVAFRQRRLVDLSGIRAEIEETRRAPDVVAAFGHYDASLTTPLASADTLLAALWEVGTYPRQLSASLVELAVDVQTLAATCDGVPDGAVIGPLDLTGPPTVYGAAPDRLGLRQPFRLHLAGPSPTAMTGVATAETPFGLAATGASFGVDPDPERIPRQTTVRLAMDPASPVQPRGADGLARLEERLGGKVGTALWQMAVTHTTAPTRALPAPLERTSLRAVAPGAWLFPDRIAIGMNIVPNPALENAPAAPDPGSPALSITTPPGSPANLRLVVSEHALTQLLKAAIASGDLARQVDAKLAEKLAPLTPAPTAFDDGSVRIRDGLVIVQAKGRMINACPLGVDLGLTVWVPLQPTVLNRGLRFHADSTDVNLDNTDAALCLLTSVLLGPFGLLATSIVLSVAAAINPPMTRTVPGFWEGSLLPRTELRPAIGLLSVDVVDGALVLEGSFDLVPASDLTFVYVQVVSLDEPSGVVRAVAGARVALLELDRPAPSGDDVVPPPTGTTSVIVHDRETTTETTYTPYADHLLADSTTDEEGLAMFGVRPDSKAGVFIRRRWTEDLVTGQQIGGVTTTYQDIFGDRPDLAITVTLPDGTVPMERQLIALNLADKRVGTIHQPVVIVLPVERPHRPVVLDPVVR